MVADLPARPLDAFDLKSLEGNWFKIMGLDSRYDCFDCQMNSFHFRRSPSSAGADGRGVLAMEALFRVPRPTAPGYLQSRIAEELRPPDLTTKFGDGSFSLDGLGIAKEGAAVPNMQSQGKMFGLTFWESWYILSEGSVRPSPTAATAGMGIGTEGYEGMGIYGTPIIPLLSAIPPVLSSIPARDRPLEAENEMKLVYYTGHTLQGSYKGESVPPLATTDHSVGLRVLLFSNF